MPLIRSVHVLVYTGDEEGAGTDGDVYVGACGREFHLDTAANDFERGSRYTYRFGTFPTVIETALNDPQLQRLRLEDVDNLPIYIRFAPASRDDRWKLQRAIVAFNSEESPLWDSATNAPDGIWLGVRSSLTFHLKRSIEFRPRDPATMADLATQLFAENPPEAPAEVGAPPEPELELVESLSSYPSPVERPRDSRESDTRPVPAADVSEVLSERKGAPKLFERFPVLGRPELWQSTAHITVCERTGTAEALSAAGPINIWDDDSLTVWGNGDWPPTAHVTCRFSVATEGLYACAVRLRSFSPWGGAVETLIDGRSFGQTIVRGATETYTFLARLGVGDHEFRARDQGFAFRFSGLTIYQVPLVAG